MNIGIKKKEMNATFSIEAALIMTNHCNAIGCLSHSHSSLLSFILNLSTVSNKFIAF